jgi:ABC-type multidrug transport system ATPase subunit
MTRALVELRGISKSFGRRRVLERIDLTVGEGARVAVIGGNGSGKSTLLSIVANVIEADEGQIRRPERIGFAPEKPDLPDHLSVAEWIHLVASLKRAPSEYLFGVDAFRHTRIGALSLGQRQRVSLAAAWLGDPRLLVLDEPTNGLDAESREQVLEQLNGRTALIATHDRPLANRSATEVVELRTAEVQGRQPLVSLGSRLTHVEMLPS